GHGSTLGSIWAKRSSRAVWHADLQGGLMESWRSHSGIWQGRQAAEWVEAPWNGCLPSTLMSESAVSTGAEGRRRALRRRHRNSQKLASITKQILTALVVPSRAYRTSGEQR